MAHRGADPSGQAGYRPARPWARLDACRGCTLAPSAGPHLGDKAKQRATAGCGRDLVHCGSQAARRGRQRRGGSNWVDRLATGRHWPAGRHCVWSRAPPRAAATPSPRWSATPSPASQGETPPHSCCVLAEGHHGAAAGAEPSHFAAHRPFWGQPRPAASRCGRLSPPRVATRRRQAHWAGHASRAGLIRVWPITLRPTRLFRPLCYSRGQQGTGPRHAVGPHAARKRIEMPEKFS